MPLEIRPERQELQGSKRRQGEKGDPINCTRDDLDHFISSLAVAEVCCRTSSSDTGPSAPSKSTRTVSKSSCSDRQRGTFPGSLSSGTSVNLMAIPGEDSLTSLPAASPVRILAPLAEERGFLALAQVCGQSSPVSLARYDPATHSLRTPQRLLFEDSQQSLQTLPAWGWMHAGVVSGLTMSGPGISANGRGFLPTARAQERQQHNSRDASVALSTAVLLPTATVHGNNNRRGISANSGDGLVTRIRRSLLPTPDAGDWKQDGLDASKRRLDKWSTMNLNAAVRLFPTITQSMATWGDFVQAQQRGNNPQRLTYATASARDWRSHKARRATLEKNSRPLNEQIGGSLNPTWLGWYMGWPMDWDARGMPQEPHLTPGAFLLWLLEYRIALNALWRSAMARCRSVPHWPGVF